MLRLAVTEERILLTEDEDFGWLVYAARVDSPGVIPIRFPASARGSLAEAILKLVRENGTRLSGAFIVLRPGLARFSMAK